MENGITIATYTMLAASGRRSAQTQKILNRIKALDWGLLILDEVHIGTGTCHVRRCVPWAAVTHNALLLVPAQMFKRVVTWTAAHCKLGLTATPVREDGKFEDLHNLIGAKV